MRASALLKRDLIQLNYVLHFLQYGHVSLKCGIASLMRGVVQFKCGLPPSAGDDERLKRNVVKLEAALNLPVMPPITLRSSD